MLDFLFQHAQNAQDVDQVLLALQIQIDGVGLLFGGRVAMQHEPLDADVGRGDLLENALRLTQNEILAEHPKLEHRDDVPLHLEQILHVILLQGLHPGRIDHALEGMLGRLIPIPLHDEIGNEPGRPVDHPVISEMLVHQFSHKGVVLMQNLGGEVQDYVQ